MSMRWLAVVMVFGFAAQAQAASTPYTEVAGENAVVQAADGGAIPRDRHRNALGDQYDLARDRAFGGERLVMINLVSGELDFRNAQHALEQKGFAVQELESAPAPEKLEQLLAGASQVWVASGTSRALSDADIAVIKRFFDAGHGVYVWGDNDPYYADANALGMALFGASMSGDLLGSQTVGLQREPGKPGFRRGHLITTGLEYLFEGVTIATIRPNDALEPLLTGSAGNLVAATYEHDGKRAIIDGGFTRLFCSWNEAGTARYVKNAAAWLANVERFGPPAGAMKKSASR